MKPYLSLLPILLLTACGKPTDGYEFGEAEFERRSQLVTVVEHASLTELRAVAPKTAQADSRELHGFSYIRPDSCEIHVTDLREHDARLWLGHEMTHCVYGRWHD